MNGHSLANRTAIVTGSTSGIGLAVARELSAEGCNIMLNGFGDSQEIEMLRSRLGSEFKVEVRYDGADVSKPVEITRLVENCVKEFGGIDILVNNAGIQHVAPIEDFPPEKWDMILAINLSASFHTIRTVLPEMKRRNWGRIINIASAHGLVASINKSAYVAAKHGLVGLTKAVALETAQTGITCNAICPGWVLTPLVQKQINDLAASGGRSLDEAEDALLSEKQPSKQFVKPGDIGSLVAFLCTKAASQIRGATLSIDGGWTAQ